MWQTGWEENLGRMDTLCMHGSVPFLFTWNYHNIVNQLHLNTKLKVKGKSLSWNKKKHISKRKQLETILKTAPIMKGGKGREWEKRKGNEYCVKCETGWNYMKHGWCAPTDKYLQKPDRPPCQWQRSLTLVDRKLPWMAHLILSQDTICP